MGKCTLYKYFSFQKDRIPRITTIQSGTLSVNSRNFSGAKCVHPCSLIEDRLEPGHLGYPGCVQTNNGAGPPPC